MMRYIEAILFSYGWTDEFYVFDSQPSPPPTRIPSSLFNESADFVQGIVESPASEEGIVELQGARSGLRVTFRTNRELSLLDHLLKSLGLTIFCHDIMAARIIK